MVEINIDVDKYLDENHLDSSMIIYNYSEPDLITDDSLVTLLSKEKRRLHDRSARFQLFNDYGELYLNEVTLKDLKEQLPKFINEKHHQTLSMETPDLPIVIDLIDQVKKMGLTVIGSRQECFESWNCVYDAMLLHNIVYSGPNIIDQYTTQKNRHGEEIMTNDQNVTVFKKHLHKKGHYIWSRVYYDVVDAGGNTIIEQIPLQTLGAVLLGLVLKLKPQNIKKLLLFPEIPDDAMADPKLRLRYEHHYRSEFLPIESITEIKLLENIPIKHDAQHIVNKFQFLRSDSELDYGNPIATIDAPNALIGIFHDQLNKSRQDERTLSNWIIQTANKANVFIQRRERRKYNVCYIKHFKIKDGQIDDIIADEKTTNHCFMYETVFEVFDHNTQQTLRYDLSLGELVTYILSLLIK
ncbi:hypothetical protein [Companilactobacillus sp. HBUAS59699]|uniref:hypothetical protein n=1 Tax=Companilactobacillus sp. HBUAS59699 TaxID=3109358 RepID=UPI002FEE7B64